MRLTVLQSRLYNHELFPLVFTLFFFSLQMAGPGLPALPPLRFPL